MVKSLAVDDVQSINTSYTKSSGHLTCGRKKHSVQFYEGTNDDSFLVSRFISSHNSKKEFSFLSPSSKQLKVSSIENLSIDKKIEVKALEQIFAAVQKKALNIKEHLDNGFISHKPHALESSKSKLSAGMNNPKASTANEAETFNFKQNATSPVANSKNTDVSFSPRSLNAASETTPPTESTPPSSTDKAKPSTSDVFMRFYILMERIIAQAERSAHELYLKIESRTELFDKLSSLAEKLNSTGGKVDWSKDEQMKQLVEEARAAGVVIPQGTGSYQWNEEQKKEFISNIRSRKESIDRMNQTEKTDMQRYMQISTQGHEFRSNVLKWEGEARRTVINNFRN